MSWSIVLGQQQRVDRGRRAGLAVVLAVLLSLLAGTVTTEAATPAAPTPAWTGWTAIPGGQTTLAGPTAISFGGRFHVFVRDNLGGIATASKGTNGWSTWATLPTTHLTDSAPAVVIHKNILTVLIRGTDNRVYRSRLVNGSWTGWRMVPDGLTDQTPAAVVVDGDLYVIVRALDGQIAQNHLAAGAWSGWSAVPGGGSTTAGPTAVVYRKKLRVIVRGFENRLYLNSRRTTGTWSGWGEIADGIGIVDPYAVVFNSQLYLFQTKNDLRIYWRTFDGTTWTAFTQEPDALTGSRPAAAVQGTRLWAVVRDTANGIQRNRF